MLVGNGLIAKTVKSCDREDVILFASGVSNSVNPNQADFDREAKLLEQHLNSDQLFIYFSTVSIEDPDGQARPYIQHKIRMENLVREKTKRHLILRLPNMASVKGNSKTLFPFFYQALIENREVTLKSSASRYLLTEEQLEHMLAQILNDGVDNRTINCIYGRAYKVVEIYSLLALHLGMEMNYKLKEGGERYQVEPNYLFHSIPEIDLEALLSATVET